MIPIASLQKAAEELMAKAAIEIGNDDPVALTLGGFGIAWFGAQPEQGLTCIERALALNPSYLLAWRLGGAVSWMAIQYGVKVSLWKRLLSGEPRLSPQDPVHGVLRDFGTTYERSESLTEAQFRREYCGEAAQQ